MLTQKFISTEKYLLCSKVFAITELELPITFYLIVFLKPALTSLFASLANAEIDFFEQQLILALFYYLFENLFNLFVTFFFFSFYGLDFITKHFFKVSY